jgi:hypothetical protein
LDKKTDTEEISGIRIRTNITDPEPGAKKEGLLQKERKTQFYTCGQCLGSAFIESGSRL